MWDCGLFYRMKFKCLQTASVFIAKFSLFDLIEMGINFKCKVPS